jgi:hypothetical protein
MMMNSYVLGMEQALPLVQGLHIGVFEREFASVSQYLLEGSNLSMAFD